MTTKFQQDTTKLSAGIVGLSLFAAYKIAKGAAAKTVAQVMQNIQAGLAALQPGPTPVTVNQLVTAIFKVLAASANLSQNLTIEDIEKLAQGIYSGLAPGGTFDFDTIWPEVQALFKGKLAGSVDPVDYATDEANLIAGLGTILVYSLEQVKNMDATATIEAILAAVNAGFAAIDTTVEPTPEEFNNYLFEALEAIADFTGNAEVVTIEGIFEKVWTVVTGSSNGFVKFFQSIAPMMKLKKAIKAAQATQAAAATA